MKTGGPSDIEWLVSASIVSFSLAEPHLLVFAELTPADDMSNKDSHNSMHLPPMYIAAVLTITADIIISMNLA